jgi:hypothetical protein
VDQEILKSLPVIFETPIFEIWIFGFSGLLLLNMFRFRRNARNSEYWPTTDGKIVHARLRRIQASMDAPGEDQVAEIFYEYVVNGSIYKSKRVSFSPIYRDFFFADKAQAYLDSFPVGETVTVHYNPRKPQASVLIPGYNADCKGHVTSQLAMVAMLTISYILVKLSF